MAARVDPYTNFNFTVEIDGIALGGFSEVTLPSASAEVIEYREGNEVNTVRKIPGLIKFGNVTLKRGITTSDELYLWWRTVQDGPVSRRSMTVVLLDDTRQPVKRWRFHNAWPMRYEASALNAQGNDVVIETVEITHEGMEIEQP